LARPQVPAWVPSIQGFDVEPATLTAGHVLVLTV